MAALTGFIQGMRVMYPELRQKQQPVGPIVKPGTAKSLAEALYYFLTQQLPAGVSPIFFEEVLLGRVSQSGSKGWLNTPYDTAASIAQFLTLFESFSAPDNIISNEEDYLNYLMIYNVLHTLTRTIRREGREVSSAAERGGYQSPVFDQLESHQKNMRQKLRDYLTVFSPRAVKQPESMLNHSQKALRLERMLQWVADQFDDVAFIDKQRKDLQKEARILFYECQVKINLARELAGKDSDHSSTLQRRRAELAEKERVFAGKLKRWEEKKQQAIAHLAAIDIEETFIKNAYCLLDEMPPLFMGFAQRALNSIFEIYAQVEYLKKQLIPLSVGSVYVDEKVSQLRQTAAIRAFEALISRAGVVASPTEQQPPLVVLLPAPAATQNTNIIPMLQTPKNRKLFIVWLSEVLPIRWVLWLQRKFVGLMIRLIEIEKKPLAKTNPLPAPEHKATAESSPVVEQVKTATLTPKHINALFALFADPLSFNLQTFKALQKTMELFYRDLLAGGLWPLSYEAQALFFYLYEELNQYIRLGSQKPFSVKLSPVYQQLLNQLLKQQSDTDQKKSAVVGAKQNQFSRVLTDQLTTFFTAVKTASQQFSALDLETNTAEKIMDGLSKFVDLLPYGGALGFLFANAKQAIHDKRIIGLNRLICFIHEKMNVADIPNIMAQLSEKLWQQYQDQMATVVDDDIERVAKYVSEQIKSALYDADVESLAVRFSGLSETGIPLWVDFLGETVLGDDSENVTKSFAQQVKEKMLSLRDAPSVLPVFCGDRFVHPATLFHPAEFDVEQLIQQLNKTYQMMATQSVSVRNKNWQAMMDLLTDKKAEDACKILATQFTAAYPFKIEFKSNGTLKDPAKFKRVCAKLIARLQTFTRYTPLDKVTLAFVEIYYSQNAGPALGDNLTDFEKRAAKVQYLIAAGNLTALGVQKALTRITDHLKPALAHPLPWWCIEWIDIFLGETNGLSFEKRRAAAIGKLALLQAPSNANYQSNLQHYHQSFEKLAQCLDPTARNLQAMLKVAEEMKKAKEDIIREKKLSDQQPVIAQKTQPAVVSVDSGVPSVSNYPKPNAAETGVEQKIPEPESESSSTQFFTHDSLKSVAQFYGDCLPEVKSEAVSGLFALNAGATLFSLKDKKTEKFADFKQRLQSLPKVVLENEAWRIIEPAMRPLSDAERLTQLIAFIQKPPQGVMERFHQRFIAIFAEKAKVDATKEAVAAALVKCQKKKMGGSDRTEKNKMRAALQTSVNQMKQEMFSASTPDDALQALIIHAVAKVSVNRGNGSGWLSQ